MLAVVDEYLNRNGFSNPKPPKRSALEAASPSAKANKRSGKGKDTVVPLSQRFAQSVDRSMGPPKDLPQKRSHVTTAPQESLAPGQEVTRLRPTILRDRRRDDWVRKLVDVSLRSVFDISVYLD